MSAQYRIVDAEGASDKKPENNECTIQYGSAEGTSDKIPENNECTIQYRSAEIVSEKKLENNECTIIMSAQYSTVKQKVPLKKS